MFALLRRFLDFQAFLVWQGGFLFYAAVVVPIGTEVLGGPFEQGRVTQSVTVWLNLIGIIWHPVLAWDALATRPFRRGRLALIATSAAILAALYVQHANLDRMLDPSRSNGLGEDFYSQHAIYLWLSAAHWFLGLISAWLTLTAWRKRDGMTSVIAPI